MSTQFTSSIPLSFAHNLTPVRLIELPPALLSLLTNSDSPQTFKIKASTGATSSVNSTENHAVLCTDAQTFSLRQVYSSNSIILLQPSVPTAPPPSHDDQETDPLTLLPPPMGLKAVSKATSYLELVPTIHDAETLLQKHIPIYQSINANTERVAPQASKATLLNALPLSDAEFEAAWKKLHCFSCTADLAHRPSASAVLTTLREIFTTAAAESLPLCPKDGFAVGSLIEVLDDDVAVPPGLIHAAVATVCDEVAGKWKLEHTRCAAFVGRAVLEEWMAGSKGDMLNASFFSRWKSYLPEECESLCTLDTIKGWYTHPTPSTIRFVPGGAVDPAAATSAIAAATGKHKWHDRLGRCNRR